MSEHENTSSIVVVKVGGSLFDWPELKERLNAMLEGLRAEGCLVAVVAGGGEVADVIRLYDRTHGLGEERAHHLALRSLDLTAAVVADLIGGGLATSVSEARVLWREGRIAVVAPRGWIEADEHTTAHPLPHCWDVTSDTIAARVASLLGAGRLMLVKSAPVVGVRTIVEAKTRGLVDQAFPGEPNYRPRVFCCCMRDGNACVELVSEGDSTDG